MKPNAKLLSTGLELLRNFLRKIVKPMIARYQIPIGSKAALARKAARRMINIAVPISIDRR